MTRFALAFGALHVVACGGGSDLDPHLDSVDTIAADTGEPDVDDSAPRDVTAESNDGGEDLPDTAAPELPIWTPPADPFDRGVLRVGITFEPLARALLGQAPTSPVPARCTFDDGAEQRCHVALTGTEQTFRALDGKASFDVALDDVPDGLSRVVLDAGLDDPSQLRTMVGHLLFRRLGLVAPRATLAGVTVDGEGYGLYTAVEAIESPHHLERATGESAGAIFVSERYTDFWPWQIADFVRYVGPEEARAALDDLAARVERFRIARLDGAPIPLNEALGVRLVLEPFLRAMAAELWLGHQGGYVSGLWGYALHVGTTGRVTFLPRHLGWSLDPSDAADPWWPSGRLVRHCLEDPTCRPMWGKILDEMIAAIDQRHFLAEVSALVALARPEIMSDTRRERSDEDIDAATDALLLTLADRNRWIGENLACTEPADVDHDGDGVSACLDDCDDDHADVHPGAPETCNLRDDDCDGTLDNAPECERCLTVSDPIVGGGATWALCYRPATWDAARADCQTRGGDLVSIHLPETQVALVRAAFGLQWSSWWIGLHDHDAEGTFVWSDGSSDTSFSAWAGGEPNDAGQNEDCAHLTSWAGGYWNDLDCARSLPYICALPRPTR